MKEREEIIRNKGSGHEIRENCLGVTSLRYRLAYDSTGDITILIKLTTRAIDLIDKYRILLRVCYCHSGVARYR